MTFRSKILPVILILARLSLAGVFIYAAVIKLRDPISFLDEIRAYRLLEDPWSGIVAISLPWVELCAGLALLNRRLVIGGSFLITLMLLAFIQAILSAMFRGLDISCGCFGTGEPVTSYSEMLIRDGIFLGLSLFILVMSWRRKKSEL